MITLYNLEMNECFLTKRYRNDLMGRNSICFCHILLALLITTDFRQWVNQWKTSKSIGIISSSLRTPCTVPCEFVNFWPMFLTTSTSHTLDTCEFVKLLADVPNYQSHTGYIHHIKLHVQEMTSKGMTHQQLRPTLGFLFAKCHRELTIHVHTCTASRSTH